MIKNIFIVFVLIVTTTYCTPCVKREGFSGKLVSSEPGEIHLQLPGGCSLYFKNLLYQDYYVDSFVSDHSGAREISHFYFIDFKKISIEYDLINLEQDTSIESLQAMIQVKKKKLVVENPSRDESMILDSVIVLSNKKVGIIKYDDKNRIFLFYCGMYRIKIYIEGAKDSEEADDILNSIHIH
jgi:hypothetical protein